MQGLRNKESNLKGKTIGILQRNPPSCVLLIYMGNLFPCTIQLQDLARITSQQIGGPQSPKPRTRPQLFPEFLKLREGCSDWLIRKMEGSDRIRVPLSAVVSDCVKRWFQDALKEARAGDSGMQVLVGQMYNSGYGVPRDEKKAKAWITKASRHRSSVWKVSDKRPGYNASDSDSDELTDDLK